MTPVIVGAMIVASLAALAQDPGARPRFEVASVKPNHSGDRIMLYQPYRGGRFTATNCSLSLLIQYAFDVMRFQISGAPEWVRTDRYDIAAKADGDPQVDQLREMLRRLLEDRFQLKYRWETKEAAVYNLVVSKAGKLRAAESGDCPPPLSARIPKPGEAPDIPCGSLMNSPGHTSGRKLSADQLAGSLSFFVQRSVIDKTTLTGKYDIALRWTPDSVQTQPVSPDAGLQLSRVDTADPSIFTALQEQLGLKLESSKGPVKFLVINHVERPDEN